MSIRILIIFIASTLFLSSSFAMGEVKKQADNVLKSGSVSGLYNRVDWVHWVDVDGDCQDARAEVLIRQ